MTPPQISIENYLRTVNKKDVPFIKVALRMGIRVSVLSKEERLLLFQDGLHKKILLDNHPSFNTITAVKLASNKHRTKIILHRAGISTPRYIIAKSLREIRLAIKEKRLFFPLVVKPVAGKMGEGVTINITSYVGLERALKHVKKQTQKSIFLVEEVFSGSLFRILVLHNKVIACAMRKPAHVYGNGKQTIKELVARKNKKQKNKITLGAVVRAWIKQKYSYTPLSIPSQKKYVQLQPLPMIHDGGEAIDYTKKVSERFQKIAATCASALTLAYGGIDLITKDITDNASSLPYAVIEINSAPNHTLNEKPLVKGPGVPVTKILLRSFMRM